MKACRHRITDKKKITETGEKWVSFNQRGGENGLHISGRGGKNSSEEKKGGIAKAERALPKRVEFPYSRDNSAREGSPRVKQGRRV